MSALEEATKWTAEEHRTKALQMSSEAANMYRLIDMSSDITEYATIQTVIMLAQVHATLALSAHDVLKPTTVNNFNMPAEIPADTLFENGYM